jgi:hypothetical protein
MLPGVRPSPLLDKQDQSYWLVLGSRSVGGGAAALPHVKAVAECIEDVPEVVRTPLGSRTEWRGPSERDALVSEGLEARLLA